MFVVLITGNIGAGKSSIARRLCEKYSLEHIDIQDFPKQGREWYEHMFIQLMNCLFSKEKGAVLELVGCNEEFPALRRTCKLLWVPLVEIEIKRSDRDKAKRDIMMRGNPGFEEEVEHLQDHWDAVWNENAYLVEEEDLTKAFLEVERIVTSGIRKHYGFKAQVSVVEDSGRG